MSRFVFFLLCDLLYAHVNFFGWKSSFLALLLLKFLLIFSINLFCLTAKRSTNDFEEKKVIKKRIKELKFLDPKIELRKF